ncbi:D-hexose-6-phosphate mutarotase [Roseateles sp. BYS180W]|uniref:Putative glucose-6-phosphate 1-epimerase n=1 Tax=Roseateles rivi TaxID=3299028 RepID=A0ABW7FR20_9BURK
MPVSIPLTRFQGLDALELRAPDGACATLLLHGAQVVSWRPAGADEQLYLSPQSAYATGQAVRGGVPVCFPQFGSRGNLTKHGFARTKPWQLVQAEVGQDDALAVLKLMDDAATRMVWPHTFEAELSVRVAGTVLELELACENHGDAPFEFSAALHTYLRLTHSMSAALQGLDGLAYWDAAAKRSGTQGDEPLGLDGELDRIYQGVGERHAQTEGRRLMLSDGARRLQISQQGFEDAVVWNPGETLCQQMEDLPDSAWREFLCVEAAQVLRPAQLAPGQTWVGLQRLELA